MNSKGNNKKEDFCVPVAVAMAMEEFIIRVLKGGENVHPQEIAILPEILKLLAKTASN